MFSPCSVDIMEDLDIHSDLELKKWVLKSGVEENESDFKIRH